MRFTILPILLMAPVPTILAVNDADIPNRYKCDTARKLWLDMHWIAPLNQLAQANLADCEVLLNPESDVVWKAK